MSQPVTGVVRQSGYFFEFCVDVLRSIPRRPFQTREFIRQAWFISRRM